MVQDLEQNMEVDISDSYFLPSIEILDSALNKIEEFMNQ